MKTSISVLIVNYNAGKLLTECVSSVLASLEPVEVLVADNASHDDSLAHLDYVLGRDARLHIFKNKKNLGFAAAVNRLLSHSQGEFVLVLNPDSILQADTLTQFCAVLQSQPQAGMVGAAVYDAHDQIETACRRRVPTPGRSLARMLSLHRWFPSQAWAQGFEYRNEALPARLQVVEGISGSCMFIRRTALEQVGMLDEGYFLHCEDLDWFMRFRAAQWDILFAPWIRVRHHKGACSHQAVRVLWYKHRGMLRFYHKFFRHHYPLPLLWLVSIAVSMRFVLLSGYTLMSRLFYTKSHYHIS